MRRITSMRPGPHEAGSVLERVGHLVDEGQHHPDDERQRRDGVDEDEPDVGVEQADAHAEQRRRRVGDDDRVVDQDRDRDHDRRDHADHQDRVAEVFAADVEARDRVGEEGAEQQREKRGRRAHEHGVAETLPDGEGLLGRLAAERRIERAEGEYLRVVVQRRLVRQPVRRPGHPLAGVLERGRDHPEDREGDEARPGEQDRVSADLAQALAPQLARPRRIGRDVGISRHDATPFDRTALADQHVDAEEDQEPRR